MQTANLHCTEARLPSERQYPPLAQEYRTHVDTAAAAFYLNRQQQTLRGWACLENGPLRPIRVHGRLAWDVASISRLLGLSK